MIVRPGNLVQFRIHPSPYVSCHMFSLCLGGGGANPNIWCRVQNWWKPKIPMFSWGGGMDTKLNFWCWVQNWWKPQVPMSGGGKGGLYPNSNFSCWVQNWWKKSLCPVRGAGGWMLTLTFDAKLSKTGENPKSLCLVGGGRGWLTCALVGGGGGCIDAESNAV